jgi:hypothetical protein
MRGDPITVILFNGSLLALFAGLWITLSKFRRWRFYKWVWFPVVALLTIVWVGALANMLYVGNGVSGNGWDAYGAAMGFFFSIPFLILDIIFLVRWPQI